MFLDVVKIIKQYFPKLTKKLYKLTYERNQNYVKYTMSTPIVIMLVGILCGIKSMRKMTNRFNTYHYVLEAKLVISIDR